MIYNRMFLQIFVRENIPSCGQMYGCFMTAIDRKQEIIYRDKHTNKRNIAFEDMERKGHKQQYTVMYLGALLKNLAAL